MPPYAGKIRDGGGAVLDRIGLANRGRGLLPRLLVKEKFYCDYILFLCYFIFSSLFRTFFFFVSTFPG